MPRRSGQPRVTRQAALIPATSARQRLGGSLNSQGTTTWQDKVRHYDLEGPGVLGYYLDTVALLASLCPLVPEVRTDDGKWVTSEDPVLITLLSGYSSSLMSQEDLISTHVRHREAMGEAWIIHSEDIGWSIATVPNVKISAGGDHITWTDMLGTTRNTPRQRAWKSFNPAPYDPAEPYSSVRRALPELRRLKAATRNQTRSAESRLLMNGLLAFPDDGGGTRPLSSPNENEAVEQGIDNVIDDYIELAKLAFRDDDAPSSAVPFPYIGAPAEYVELGRGIDEQALRVEEKAIDAFARAVNFPSQLLVNGPGSANHWNEWVLQEVQHKMGLAPKLRPVCNDLTVFYLRPMVQRVKDRIGQWEVDGQRIRVGFDMSYLTQKPDMTAQILQAWQSGVASREEVANALGIERTLSIPDGMDPYEHWELATGKPGAPYADVDHGQLVEAPDIFADGMDPSALPVVNEPEEEGGDLPAIDHEAEKTPEEMEAQRLPEELLTGIAQHQTPPPDGPPPLMAAADAGDDPRTPNGSDYQFENLTDSLFSADAALEAGLIGASQVIVAAVISHVVKEIIKAHPSRGEKRRQLRNMPMEQVWQQSDPEVRRSFDLQRTINEAIAEYEDQLSEQFDEAEAAALLALIAAGILGEEDGADLFKKAAGAAVLTALIAAFIARYFDEAKPSQRISPGIARLAMAAAGGALIGGDGLPQRSPAGVPAAGDGGQWQGNTGMATGNDVVTRIINVTGRRPALIWKHGFLRKPAEPFIPHLKLDNMRFENAADIPGGVFPGDHPNCTCVLWFDWRIAP